MKNEEKSNKEEFETLALASETQTSFPEFNLMFLNNGVILTNPARENIVHMSYGGAAELLKLLQKHLGEKTPPPEEGPSDDRPEDD